MNGNNNQPNMVPNGPNGGNPIMPNNANKGEDKLHLYLVLIIVNKIMLN